MLHKEAPAAEEIRRAINENGTVTAAAAALGVSRPTLYKWMRLYAIRIERMSKAA